MKFACFLLLSFFSFCYPEEKVSINPSDFFDKILQAKTNRELVDLAKTHDLNVTFTFTSAYDEGSREAIQVFVNNGHYTGKAELDLTKASKDDLEKIIEKARKNGMFMYFSREKYNNEGVLIEGFQYHNHQEFIFDLNHGKGIIKLKNDDFSVEMATILIEHNVRVYNHTYTKNGEIEKTLQYDIIQPKIEVLDETKYDHPDTLIVAKTMLRNVLLKGIELESRAEAWRSVLDAGIKEYAWEVIINPKAFYSSYDVKIALKVEDVEYYCLGRQRKTDDSKK